MKLESYLTEETVFAATKASNKQDLLQRMIHRIATTPAFRSHPQLTVKALEDAVDERERQCTTGLGQGLAFPHARLAELTRPLVAVAVLEQAIPFDAVDGKDVDIVCMVLTPISRPMVALKAMSQLVRHLKDETVRRDLHAAQTSAELHRCLCDLDIRLDVSIVAGDIMRESLYTCRRETPLRDLARELARYRQSAAAVVEDGGKFVGEVTCDILFKFGLPEFFSSLKSVAFIEDYDPFEKYFEEEAGTSVGDLLSSECETVTPNTPILHIVFALAVKRCKIGRASCRERV